MRRVIALALAICLAGCGVIDLRVALPTRDTGRPWDGSCVLLSEIADVIADPISGTPINAATGEPFTWAEGFTARRVPFSEVVVLDPTGNVVLTTGGRYDLCPHEYLDGWVIGNAKPCPDCELGVFLR